MTTHSEIDIEIMRLSYKLYRNVPDHLLTPLLKYISRNEAKEYVGNFMKSLTKFQRPMREKQRVRFILRAAPRPFYVMITKGVVTSIREWTLEDLEHERTGHLNELHEHHWGKVHCTDDGRWAKYCLQRACNVRHLVRPPEGGS